MAFKQITLQEFGQKIKAKYTQYNDLEDTDLAQRIITKHPQYQKAIIITKPKVAPEPKKPTGLARFIPESIRGI